VERFVRPNIALRNYVTVTGDSFARTTSE